MALVLVWFGLSMLQNALVSSSTIIISTSLMTSYETSTSTQSTISSSSGMSDTLNSHSSVAAVETSFFLDMSDSLSLDQTTVLNLDENLTQLTTATTMMSTSENFSATLLPSSLVSDLFPSASMTPTGSTTTSGPTTTPSIDQVTCGGDAVLVGGNTTMRLLAPHVVVYACKPGYQETGDGVNVIECNSNTWKPSTPLQCVLVEEEEEPVKEVPTWIPALIILMVIFLVVVVVGVVAVAVWVCRGNHFRKPITTWQQEEQEQNQQEHLQPRPPTPKKPEKTTRRWPWQRPSKPPPGHFGLDGVAWTVSPDDSILPVKRRF